MKVMSTPTSILPAYRAHAAKPKKNGDAAHAEEFDSREEVGESVDRVLVRLHVDAI